ncbi:MAG: FtsW/RodA/SpoVE family cell cycle protein [Anaerovoracaceae bacterium]
MRQSLRNSDKVLLFLPLVFAVISIVMVGSTSYTDQFNITRDIIVQTLAYVIGYVLMMIMISIDYTQYEGIYKFLYVFSIVFMLLVYTPLGVSQNGSRAWITLGFTTLQPCEFVKITFTLWYASYLKRHKDELNRFKGLLKSVLWALPIIGVIGVEDLGNALVLCFMMIMMIFLAGVDGKLFAKCIVAVVACMPVAYLFMQGHQKERIDAFLHPSDKTLPGNYQVWNSKVAIGSGGVTGKGLFQGTQKSLDYLPVAKSDFIFSVIGEELGLVGGLAVIGLYALFIYRIIRIARNARDIYGMLIVTGLCSMFFFQLFENIGMTMGIMPVTGITLPFISYGGTSVIANLMALGIIIGIGARSKVIHFD